MVTVIGDKVRFVHHLRIFSFSGNNLMFLMSYFIRCGGEFATIALYFSLFPISYIAVFVLVAAFSNQ